MKRTILYLTTTALVLIFGVVQGWGQILTFEFSALAGNETTATSNSNDANLTSSTISRGSGLTASNNGGRFNATSWALTSIANAVTGDDYMEFTITPQSGYQFSVSSIYIQLQRSSTGPRGVALRSSVDSYASDLDEEYAIPDVTSTQNYTFTFSQTNSSSPVTYRIYMWAESTGGSGGIGDGSGNDIVVSGTTSSTGSGPDNPSSFTAITSSSSQIDLSWAQNGDTDNVMIVYDEDGTFTDPEDGTSYSVSSSALGGTVIYNESGTSFDHQSLSSGTQYFYKAWSVDGDDNYSSGVTNDATTFDVEPTNHPEDFSAIENSSSAITTSWTDAVAGDQAPSGYLILASTSGSFTNPIDGTTQSDDINLGDGSGVKNIGTSVETYQWTGLNASTLYYFKIFAYNGSGATINYKTDGTVPTTNATTDDPPPVPKLIISEVADPADESDARFVELYNSSASSIELTDWQIRRYANASTSSSDVNLTGTINAGETFVVAYNATFNAEYGVVPDMTSGYISGNGNDTYELYDGSNVIDIYGEVGVDGTGQPWEYLNSKAVRKNSITTPNPTWTASEWTIVSSCYAARMTPAIHPASAWNGDAAKSNDWTTTGNWDNGLTGSGISAHIPSSLTNYPTLTASATIENLRMGDGATLLGGENLTIEGTATIQKNMVGYSGTNDGWNIISAPVNVMAIPGSDWVPVSGEDDFYVFDVAENTWRNYLDGTNPATWFDYFDVGQGYLASYHANNDGIKNFIGTLNSDDSYTFNLVYGTYKWNYVGNPYPSKIDGVTPTNASSMKFISATDGSYVDIGSDEIDVCQGFVVFAESGSASVSAARSNQTHGTPMKAGDEINRMKLRASSGENTVYAWLVVNENSSSAFEWQTDSRYLQPISDLPRLSMLTSDEIKVSTNAFSVTEESEIIQVSFNVLENETITFTLEDFANTSGVKNIILEDQAENTFTTLSDGESYTFNATTGDDPLRFKLHVNGANGFDELGDSDWFDVYSSGNTIYFNSNKAENIIVNIYNCFGQLIVSKQLNISGLTQFEVEAQTGWYLIKVLINENSFAKKVFIY